MKKKIACLFIFILSLWSFFWAGAMYSYNKEIECYILDSKLNAMYLEQVLISGDTNLVSEFITRLESDIKLHESIKNETSTFKSFIMVPLAAPIILRDHWSICQYDFDK